jgi:hypothetical protein
MGFFLLGFEGRPEGEVFLKMRGSGEWKRLWRLRQSGKIHIAEAVEESWLGRSVLSSRCSKPPSMIKQLACEYKGNEESCCQSKAQIFWACIGQFVELC